MGIDASEVQDFRDTVRRYGYSERDFQFSEVINQPGEDERRGVFVESATVTVTSSVMQISRTYDAGGHGTNWVASFAQDLRSGAFGDLPGRG